MTGLGVCSHPDEWSLDAGPWTICVVCAHRVRKYPRCGCRKGGGGEVVLPRPAWLPAGERPNGVPVDPCIAATITNLWAHDVRTLGSCCGHGDRPPSVVLEQAPMPAERVAMILDIIGDTDDRPWDLCQWQLVAL